MDDGGSDLHFLDEREGEGCHPSLPKKQIARGTALQFVNEGVDDALHFFNERKGEGFCSSLFQ